MRCVESPPGRRYPQPRSSGTSVVQQVYLERSPCCSNPSQILAKRHGAVKAGFTRASPALTLVEQRSSLPIIEQVVKGTRRTFLKAAATAAGAATNTDLAGARAPGQDQSHQHQAVPSDLTLRVKSLESLLVEKGLVDSAALDALIDTMQHKVGPRNGARVVARAWMDPAYKKRLMENAPAAFAELGYTSGQGEHTLVVENGPKVHNLVVCTLCSCYPWPVLGLPPVWYKSAPYRSRAVINPRGILREFGTQLPDDVEVRVWDSTAELRYLVLPERPAGTDTMTEEQLAALVTRDAMIGVAKVTLPTSGGNA